MDLCLKNKILIQRREERIKDLLEKKRIRDILDRRNEVSIILS